MLIRSPPHCWNARLSALDENLGPSIVTTVPPFLNSISKIFAASAIASRTSGWKDGSIGTWHTPAQFSRFKSKHCIARWIQVSTFSGMVSSLPWYTCDVPSKKVPTLLVVLSKKLSGITRSPGRIDSCREPQAVDANMWVQPASRRASMFAR